MSPKPNIQNSDAAIRKFVKFLIATLIEFFARTSPLSSSVNPACITRTSAAQRRSQAMSTVSALVTLVTRSSRLTTPGGRLKGRLRRGRNDAAADGPAHSSVPACPGRVRDARARAHGERATASTVARERRRPRTRRPPEPGLPHRGLQAQREHRPGALAWGHLVRPQDRRQPGAWPQLVAAGLSLARQRAHLPTAGDHPRPVRSRHPRPALLSGRAAALHQGDNPPAGLRASRRGRGLDLRRHAFARRPQLDAAEADRADRVGLLARGPARWDLLLGRVSGRRPARQAVPLSRWTALARRPPDLRRVEGHTTRDRARPLAVRAADARPRPHGRHGLRAAREPGAAADEGV